MKDFKGRYLQTCEDGDLNSRNPQQSANPHTIQLLRHVLSVEDLDRAETVMIKTVQSESFRDEIELLQKPESIFDKENRESVL